MESAKPTIVRTNCECYTRRNKEKRKTRRRWSDEFYENLNRNQTGIGHRPSYCQPVLEKKKRNVFVTFLRIFQAEPDFRLTLRISKRSQLHGVR